MKRFFSIEKIGKKESFKGYRLFEVKDGGKIQTGKIFSTLSSAETFLQEKYNGIRPVRLAGHPAWIS